MQFLNRSIVIHWELKVSSLVASMLLAAVAFYIGWEWYWYNKVGFIFIKWHTHIVFTGLLLGLFCLPFLLLYLLRKSERTLRWLMVSGSVFVALMIAEVFLLITGWNKVYMEQTHGYYNSPYVLNTKNVYNIAPPNSSSKLETKEFSHPRTYNSMGYSGAEWDTGKKEGVVRIITLGDSFTEGDGASADSSYPALLSDILNTKGYPAEVLNAGICGSDPVFGFKNLNDRLLQYHPDIVIQTISESDITYDIPLRGGFERFAADSAVHFKTAPWWEPVIAMSYVARLFMGLAGCDISQLVKENDPAFINQTNEFLKQLTHKFDSIAGANQFKVFFVLLPDKIDMEQKKFPFNFKPLAEQIKSSRHIQLVDLLPLYLKYSETSGKPYTDYYWVIDGHHNSTGYKMMAECIAAELKQGLKP